MEINFRLTTENAFCVNALTLKYLKNLDHTDSFKKLQLDTKTAAMNKALLSANCAQTLGRLYNGCTAF